MQILDRKHHARLTLPAVVANGASRCSNSAFAINDLSDGVANPPVDVAGRIGFLTGFYDAILSMAVQSPTNPSLTMSLRRCSVCGKHLMYDSTAVKT